MAFVLSRAGFTQICMARGTVAKTGVGDARTGVGDAEGELQLWYREGSNEYRIIKASKTARGAHGVVVCKVIDVFTQIHFQKCTDKIKTLLTKRSNT